MRLPRLWRRGGRAPWLVLALLVGGVAVSVAWSVWPSPGGPRANPDDPRQVALGQEVYRAHCASCHGADLEGEPDWQTRRPDGRMPAPPHDASGHTWHHPDGLLFEIVRHGLESVVPGYESEMPAFEGVLEDDEIWAVLAFIKRSWPERERAFQEHVTRAARDAER